MGEHGDSEIATWSLTNIAGMNVDQYCRKICDGCDGSFKYKIHEEVKNAAYNVIDRKGATYYAVALAIRRIVEAILGDENSILTVSTLLEGQFGVDGLFLGVPAIVGKDGVKKILEVPLNHEELTNFQKSANSLKDVFSNFDI